MTGKTRIFWLLANHKTVREVDSNIARKYYQKRHFIYVHGDSEFYTTKNWIPFVQFNQCIAHLKET